MAKRAMKVRLNIGECMMGEAEEWMREVRVGVSVGKEDEMTTKAVFIDEREVRRPFIPRRGPG